MAHPMLNVCSYVLQRQTHGRVRQTDAHRHMAEVNRALVNLIREDVIPMRREYHSTWPVGRWQDGYISICVLFYYEEHEDFLEDLFFCGHCFDSVLYEHHFLIPPL